MAESNSVKKTQTYEDIVDDIYKMQDLIRRYQKGDISAMEPYSYADALRKLSYLRNRQIQLKKKLSSDLS